MSEMAKPRDYYVHFQEHLLELAPITYKSVLDVGCGEGNSAFYLKEKGATYVAGVEINGEAAAAAREKMDYVWEGSIEEEIPFQRGQFDLIICADVLEHLIDPWKVLGELKTILAADGYLLTSIPNLRYAPVLYELLVKGLFRYTTFGVLDSTHLRFFTRSTMKYMIEESGFEIVRWGRPVKTLKCLRLNTLTLGIFNDFLTTQYYILARPVY